MSVASRNCRLTGLSFLKKSDAVVWIAAVRSRQAQDILTLGRARGGEYTVHLNAGGCFPRNPPSFRNLTRLQVSPS